MRAPAPVPSAFTTAHRLCRRNAQTAGLSPTWPVTVPLSLQTTPRSGRSIRWTRRGFHSTPPLATAAMKRAICIGVTSSRPWQIDIAGPIIVIGTLGMGGAVLAEASLSFLGLGIRPPFPSWGSMLSDARDQISTAPWISIFPGLAIFLTVLGLNLLGDGLRDILDPHSQLRKA